MPRLDSGHKTSFVKPDTRRARVPSKLARLRISGPQASDLVQLSNMVLLRWLMIEAAICTLRVGLERLVYLATRDDPGSQVVPVE